MRNFMLWVVSLAAIFLGLWLAFAAAGTWWSGLYAVALVIVAGIMLHKDAKQD